MRLDMGSLRPGSSPDPQMGGMHHDVGPGSFEMSHHGGIPGLHGPFGRYPGGPGGGNGGLRHTSQPSEMVAEIWG